jgi:hypothetical protein
MLYDIIITIIKIIGRSTAVLTAWNVNVSGVNHCTILQILSVDNCGTDELV